MDRKLRSAMSVVVAVITVFSCLGVNVTAFELSSEPERRIVAPGDDTTLRCVVSGDDFSIFSNPLTFFKGEDMVQINNLQMINQPFKDTDRYSAKLAGTNNNELHLTLSGVTATENDTYTCKIGDELSVTHTVIVPEAIESVIFSSNNTETDGVTTKFLFDALQSSFISCEVKGGRPKPKVKILLGDEDITNQFDELMSPVELGEGTGLETTKYQAILTNKNFKPSTEQNGQEMKCKARVDMKKVEINAVGMQGLTVESSAQMEIRFLPEFDCKQYAQSDLNVDSFELKCTVRAFPQIMMDRIEWSFKDRTGNDTIMKMKESTNEYETYATVNEKTGNVTITLSIKVVDHLDFKAYKLKVENELGQKEHEISFFLKTTTDKPAATASERPNPGANQVGTSGSATVFGALVSLAISLISVVVIL